MQPLLGHTSGHFHGKEVSDYRHNLVTAEKNTFSNILYFILLDKINFTLKKIRENDELYLLLWRILLKPNMPKDLFVQFFLQIRMLPYKASDLI